MSMHVVVVDKDHALHALSERCSIVAHFHKCSKCFGVS
jgi:hypothetical protein